MADKLIGRHIMAERKMRLSGVAEQRNTVPCGKFLLEVYIMKHQTFTKAVLCCLLMAMFILSAQVKAQPSRSRGRGLYGDWLVKVDYDRGQFESILYFSRDKEGKQIGHWISFMGVTELKDLKLEENKLSFVQVYRFGENEFSSNFTGTIEDGKLTGTLSSDRGETKVEGKRSQRMPRAVGNWEMKLKIGDREITLTLVIKADKEGKLTGNWQSQRGESPITDVQYERGNLTFKRTSTYQGNQRESTFEGTIRGDTLSGVMKSERGEITIEGKLIGAPVIGTWNLEIASEQGSRKQRLRVNPDMSGLYGTIPIKKVNLEGDQVSFETVLKFGEQEYKMSFEGKLEDSKLSGELTTSRGTRKVKGTKVIRTFRRRSTT